MKVLFVASECEPFIKTGGLGDVVGALPRYLCRLGIDVRVVVPFYKDIEKEYLVKLNFVKSFNVNMNWRKQYCGVFECMIDGVIYYYIDNKYYFDRDRIYGFYDDGERFSFFDRAVLEMLKEIEYKPDVIHCNDWHTGMIPVLYKNEFSLDDFYRNIKTVFTIHNIAYQGIFPPEILEDLLNLNEELFYNGSVEFYGCSSFMKGGINYSDCVTTVSKTYAEEIKTPGFGEKLDGLLRIKGDNLIGIINGIDYSVYNPEEDSFIYKNFGLNSLEKKKENKLMLQRELELPIDSEVPLFAVVSRLVRQKGINLLIQIIDKLMEKQIQLVILGTGEKEYEDHFRNLEIRYPDKVSTNIYFDDILAHKIYAGSDMFLMPSLFEPCGLGQLIALRYGSIPIVRETGGLKDTIISYNETTGIGNGFSFAPYNAHDFLYTIERALSFYNDKEVWGKIINQAMTTDNSWEKSASEYLNIYKSLLNIE